jgi:hypothetical protein
MTENTFNGISLSMFSFHLQWAWPTLRHLINYVFFAGKLDFPLQLLIDNRGFDVNHSCPRTARSHLIKARVDGLKLTFQCYKNKIKRQFHKTYSFGMKLLLRCFEIWSNENYMAKLPNLGRVNFRYTERSRVIYFFPKQSIVATQHDGGQQINISRTIQLSFHDSQHEPL